MLWRRSSFLLAVSDGQGLRTVREAKHLRQMQNADA